MKTVITTSVSEAAVFVRNGGVVAFPTETVYGLGAGAFDSSAIAKIFEAKRRPGDNPLIAHVATHDQIRHLTHSISHAAQLFIDAFFPGPLTVVLPKSEYVPMIATAGLDTIGVRMPRFQLAKEFIAACGTPVVAPSANVSGKPSPTTWQAVLEDLDGRIDCILQGDMVEIGLESTVVDCTGDVPILLRQGAISLVELQAVVSATTESYIFADDAPRSPGLKHRHYSPSAKVVIVDSTSEISNLKFEISDPRFAGYIGMNNPAMDFAFIRKCESVEEYAHALFEFFRECDRLQIRTIYCEEVPETGIGAAVMDRLRRAALR